MASLELKDKVNWDYFILLVAKTGMRFSELIKQLPEDKPIFVDGAVYNSTVNNILARHCKECNIPVISIHGLRHPYVKPTTKKFITFLKFFGQLHSCP